MCAVVRSEVGIALDADASGIPVLYGGSANPGNAESLAAQPDIDGALVGGASLVAADFAANRQSVRAGLIMVGQRVLFIVGPTASGKTAASLELASQACIEIVNADSRQVYRGMSVGTGKPTPAELGSVPHHLIDIAAPDERYNLARFLTEARAAIADVASCDARARRRRRHGAIRLGTRRGLAGTPAVPPDPQLRAEFAEEAHERGAEALHQRLRAVDARAANAIDPRNVRRVIRALEVWHETGAPFSRQRRKSPPEFEPVLLGIAPERAALRQHADDRVDVMLSGGWLRRGSGVAARGLRSRKCRRFPAWATARSRRTCRGA